MDLKGDEILVAKKDLENKIYNTPLVTSTSINRLTSKNIFLKMENQQKTGAFKLRGAIYKISKIESKKLSRGLIAASAGNHAQGVALAAYRRGIETKIYMPKHTPLVKVKATQNYGANVVLTGESYQEAYEAARIEQEETNSYFIHPFDDCDVIAGQGSIVLEMLEQQPKLDTIIVPVGGGGLISGIAIGAKFINPNIRIIGVQVENACVTYNRFHGYDSNDCSNISTIADGIAVKKTGSITFPLINKYVDDMISVTETDVATAIIYLLQRNKTLVEGAGATAFAGLLAHGSKIQSKNCGVVVSGGNIDIEKLSTIQKLAKKKRSTLIVN